MTEDNNVINVAQWVYEHGERVEIEISNSLRMTLCILLGCAADDNLERIVNLMPRKKLVELLRSEQAKAVEEWVVNTLSGSRTARIEQRGSDHD